AHPEFRLKLLELYSDLTKMELRICTLIRMNLKSDDISRLTCLSERNIENHRYRIRKKMKLVKEQDLGQELAKM
ncbi:MAG: helix-turn-helix transcriptional regulator, partial [Candidatus Kapaibacterium sp.]